MYQSLISLSLDDNKNKKINLLLCNNSYEYICGMLSQYFEKEWKLKTTNIEKSKLFTGYNNFYLKKNHFQHENVVFLLKYLFKKL